MRFRSGLVLLAVAIAACGRTGAPPAPDAAPPAARAGARPASAEQRARALQGSAQALERVAGHWGDAGAGTVFTGYFGHGELRYLEATVTAPGAPALTNRYYFENGALFYYSGMLPATAAGATPGAVPAHAEFQGQRTLAAVRVEHFGEVRLDERAIATIRREAATLASAIVDERAAAH